MKPKTQFKIESVEDIKNNYIRNKEKFSFHLEREINDFKHQRLNYMVCDDDGHIFVHGFNKDYEIISNPYRTKPENKCKLGEAMKQVEEEAQKLGWTAQISFKSNK